MWCPNLRICPDIALERLSKNEAILRKSQEQRDRPYHFRLLDALVNNRNRENNNEPVLPTFPTSEVTKLLLNSIFWN